MRTFYVYFKDDSSELWWQRFIKGHCWVMEEREVYGMKYLIRTESLVNIIETDVSFVTIDQVDPLIRELHNNVRCIKIKCNPDPLKHFSLFHHLNCVSTVKKVLGINKPLIVTPNQFYKYLLTKGEEYGFNIWRGTRYLSTGEKAR